MKSQSPGTAKPTLLHDMTDLHEGVDEVFDDQTGRRLHRDGSWLQWDCRRQLSHCVVTAHAVHGSFTALLTVATCSAVTLKRKSTADVGELSQDPEPPLCRHKTGRPVAGHAPSAKLGGGSEGHTACNQSLWLRGGAPRFRAMGLVMP